VAGAVSGAAIKDIDSEIDCIQALGPERNVFLHPVWLRAWLAEFGDSVEPVFLTCESPSPLAVAAMMRDDARLTFIGDPGICDFMDFAVDTSRLVEAHDALWRQIQDEEWSELELWGLTESSPTRPFIKERARSAGFEVTEEQEAVSPRIQLPSSWDDYLASLPKKDRHELRRKLRRLFDSGARVELAVYDTQADVNAAMDEFLRLHTISRQDKAEFMSGRMPLFFRRMASALSREGLVRLFMLWVDGKPSASVLCFDAGSALYMYNSGYDPEYSSLSVGLLSKALCIQWAIEHGKEQLDFLRGNEAYKYDLGARDQDIYRLTVRRAR
jgi:CelD/BcsL family acetyltransferase involved in cellulose biosynthesis